MNVSTRSIAEEGATGSSAGGLGLSWIVEVLRRRIWVFVIVATASFLAAATFGLMQPLRYSASAYILLDSRQQNVTGNAPVLSGLQVDSSVTDSQVQVLKSRQMAQRVVDRLQLQNVPEFTKAPSAGLGVRRWLGLNTPPPDVETGSLKNRAVEALMQKIGVGSLGLSSVLQVSADSKSPTLSAQIANAFAQSYVDDQRGQKTGANSRAVNFLASRLKQLRESAEASDAALRRYEVANGIVGLQSATGATANQQEIQSLTSELSAARGAQAEAEAKLAALSGGTDPINSGDGARSPVIQDLKKQRSAAAAQLAQLSARYGPLYNEVIALTEQVRNFDRAIATEARTIRDAAVTDARAARGRTAQIQSTLGRAEGSLKGANIASVEANQLRTRADTDRSVYLSFLERYKQTAAQSGFETPDARIISPATPPTRPSSISLKILALVGFMAGIALGLIFVVVVEMIWGGMYREDQFEHNFRISALGTVPEVSSTLKRGQADFVSAIDFPQAQPLSAVAEMVRGISGNRAFGAGPPHRMVTITSALPSEGKSTTSILIARMLAQSGLRTLLVDGDLIARSATRMLGGTPVGLNEVAVGDIPFERAVIRDLLTPLDWIGISDNGRHDALFSTVAADSILAKMRADYDIVIVDSAPILATADARALAVKSDCVVLAVRWATTRRSAVRAAIKLLRALGARTAGAVLTRVDMRKQARMGDAGTYDYYKQYRDYAR